MVTAARPHEPEDRHGCGTRSGADDLHDVACRELAEICGVVNAAHGRMVRLMVDVLADEAWGGAGVLSPLHWLTWKTSLSRSEASAVLNLAKRSSELSATVAALGEGRLSLACAGVIARYVPAEYETSVLEVASVLTVIQLRRSVSQYYFDIENPAPSPSPDPAPAPTPGSGDGVEETGQADSGFAPSGGEAAPDGSGGGGAGGAGREPVGMQGGRLVWPTGRPIEERLELTMGIGANGTWSATLRLPPDLGAAFEAAVRTRRDDLHREAKKGLGPDDPPAKFTLVDALLSIAEGALVEGAAARPGTDRFLVHAHLTAGPTGENALQLHLGATLPRHLRRLYTCDCTIRPVLETDGIPVNVGRLQHSGLRSRLNPVNPRRPAPTRSG